MKKLLFKWAMSILKKNLEEGENLKPEHLVNLGWKKIPGYGTTMMVEPEIKDRDMVWIEFCGAYGRVDYYRVWHGRERTFIALKAKKAWFDAYYMLLKDN